MGRRFVAWEHLTRNGKPTKVPIQPSGKWAKSTDPETWTTLDEASAFANRARKAGVGFVLAGETDGIGGIDLDGCRNPETGEIQPWAQEIITDFGSYAEVSPSSTGVKIFAKGDPLPELPVNKLVMGDAPLFGDHLPQVEVYTTGRYFALTGRKVDGVPDSITDATAAWMRLAARLARAKVEEPAKPATQDEPRPAVEDAQLPASFRNLLDQDDRLRAAWRDGAKLGKGKDTTASGLEMSLALYLARHLADDDLESVLRLYPYGQIGGGKISGRNADRRIGKLLDHAQRIRDRAARADDKGRWWNDLSLNDKGDARDTIANVATILRADGTFAGKLGFDELRNCVVTRSLPWKVAEGWREWADLDDLRLTEWCQLRDVQVKPATVAAAVQVVASEQSFHPVRDYLDDLQHDGTKRLDTWLTTYLGVPDTPYSRAVGRKFLIAAVARARRPGCKADNALILEGEQDLGKSSAARVLAVMSEWFADEIADLGSKDSAQDLKGKWIIEMAELSAMRRSDVERTKAFLSRSTDHYRPSYGRRSQDFKRQCVFIGSTNQEAYLHDETGNRRFWPVRVGRIDLKGLRANLGQLWAEADAAFKSGEHWWLEGNLKPLAQEEQGNRRIGDPWEPAVEKWLVRIVHTTGCRARKDTDPVTIEDILVGAIDMPVERQDLMAQKRVGAILRSRGWTRQQKRRPVEEGGGRYWIFNPPVVTSEPTGGPGSGDSSGDSQSTENTGSSADVTDVTDCSRTHKAGHTTEDARIMKGGGGLRREHYRNHRGQPVTGDIGMAQCATCEAPISCPCKEHQP
jgi:predicted P-loop ATPase